MKHILSPLIFYTFLAQLPLQGMQNKSQAIENVGQGSSSSALIFAQNTGHKLQEIGHHVEIVHDLTKNIAFQAIPAALLVASYAGIYGYTYYHNQQRLNVQKQTRIARHKKIEQTLFLQNIPTNISSIINDYDNSDKKDHERAKKKAYREAFNKEKTPFKKLYAAGMTGSHIYQLYGILGGAASGMQFCGTALISTAEALNSTDGRLSLITKGCNFINSYLSSMYTDRRFKK